MLKRSNEVGHDRGKWHCVTGYVGEDVAPLAQALTEVFEETGLSVADLHAIESGPVLWLQGGGSEWEVHVFKVSTLCRRLSLNWEHDEYRWVPVSRLRRFDGRVDWLDQVVLSLTGHS